MKLCFSRYNLNGPYIYKVTIKMFFSRHQSCPKPRHCPQFDLRNQKASVAGTQQVKGKVGGDEGREVRRCAWGRSRGALGPAGKGAFITSEVGAMENSAQRRD